MSAPADTAPHLLHVFSTFGVGGPQTRFVGLANALGRKYRHTVLAMDGNLDASAGLDPRVDWSPAVIPMVKTASVSIANLRNARRLLRALRPDLLVTYNWGTIEWSIANWGRFCRHVHIEDGFGPDETPQSQNWRRVATRRLLLSRCERIIVPSVTLYEVAERRWRLPRGLVMYLPNGIDCDRFARATDARLLETLGIGANAKVVGTLAGLRREKNLPRLLRIVAALPPELGARLVMIGDGPERATIAAAAARLGIAERTILAGAMAEPERLLGRFNVFALTSDTEQMPNSVLEAMAAGLPVLATDVGDIKRILAPENGAFVLPREDEGALSQALHRLLGDDDLRQRLGQANRAHVRANYRLDTMVARYDAVFQGTA